MSSVRSRNSSLPPSAQGGGGSSRRATSASASGGGGGGGSRHSVTSVAAASASARTRASHSARRSLASAGGAGGQQKAPPSSPPPPLPPPPPPAPAADHSSVDSWETDDTAGGGRAVDTGPACRGSMLPRSSTGYLRDYHADELAVDSCAAAGEENEEEEDQQGRAVVAAAAAEKKVSPEAVAAAVAGSIVNEESSGASSIEEEEEEEEEGEGGVLKADDGGDDDNNTKGEDDYDDEDEEQEERGEVEGQQRHPQRKTKKQQKKEDKKNMKKRVPPPPSPAAAAAATPQSSSSLRLAAPPSPHDSPKTLTLPTTTTAAAATAPSQHPRGALVCPVTQEPVKVYCHDDGALDCLICPSQDRHRGHRVELLRDFCASQKRVLAADRGACRSLIGNLKELEEDTPLRATRLHTQVDEAIDSVVAALNERRRALHDDIRKRSQILISDLSGELTSRKQQLQHLESATLTLTLLSNGRGVAPEGSIGDLLRGTMTYDEFLAVGDPDMPPAPTIKQLLNVRVPLKMREEILHFDWSAETRDNHPLVYPPKGF